MNKLKPCPFCGGEMIFKYSSAKKAFLFYHRHMTACKFVQPFEMIAQLGIESLADAAEVWNRRAE